MLKIITVTAAPAGKTHESEHYFRPSPVMSMYDMIYFMFSVIVYSLHNIF